MIKVIFASLLVMSSYFGFSQDTKDVSVEKSIFGIQIGLLGIWTHNELKLSNQIALRSEIGFGGLNTLQLTEPMLVLEPRWYYNLNKRTHKNKRVDGNSGNYISIRARYYLSAITADDKHNISHMLAPTWGIRRNIGRHFNYEVGLGMGLGHFYDDDNKGKTGVTSYMSLRIGYRF